ncbi:MAG: hypothetical protein ACKOPT_17940, partial [Cyanobium sp.]
MVEGLGLPAHLLKLLTEQGAHVLIIIQDPEQDRRMVSRVNSHFSGKGNLLKGIEEETLSPIHEQSVLQEHFLTEPFRHMNSAVP